MLSKLILLRLKGMFNRSLNRNGKRSAASAALMGLLLIFCALSFGAAFFFLFSELAQALHDTAYDWFYFAMLGLMSFAMSFFFTAFTAKSELFEARDNELLLSMPIPPRTILLSRMAVMLCMEYLISFLVMIPAGLAWFLATGINVGMLTLYVVGALMLPLLSASLACLLGWLLAVLTAHMRSRTILTMAFYILFLCVYFYFYYNASSYIQLLVVNHAAIAGHMRVWGFLFCWFGEGIARVQPLQVLGVCAVSLGCFALTAALLARGILRTTSHAAVRRRTAKEVRLEASTASRALLRRELRRFTGLPVYMMNCGLGLLLSVIAAVAALVKMQDLRLLLLSLAQSMELSERNLGLLVAMAISFFTSMDIVTAPSVSLEGRTLWILRSAPVPTRKVLHAKLALHLLLCAPPALLLSIVAGIVLRADVLCWLALLALPQLFLLLSGTLGLMMNLIFPKLDWTSETVAVKQSGAAVVTMLLLMLAAMAGFIGALLLPTGAFSAAFAALTAVCCWLILWWLETRGVKRFDRL